MGTLGGFPNPPTLWLRQAKPAFAYAIMGTLGGFPNPPTLWLRQAKPAFAYAIMGTLGGFAPPFGPPPATSSPLAFPFGDFGTCTFPTTPARCARALALGLAKPSHALAPAGKARLRLRD